MEKTPANVNATPELLPCAASANNAIAADNIANAPSIGTIRSYPAPRDSGGGPVELAVGYKLMFPQVGYVEFEFDMKAETPDADGIISFNDSAVEMGLRSRRSIEVRVNAPANRFEAFNVGVGWRADVNIPVVVGQDYRILVRTNLNASPRVYSVYVDGVQIADGYAMRPSFYTGQPIADLAHMGLLATTGVFSIRDFSHEIDGPWQESAVAPIEPNNPLLHPDGTRTFFVGPGRAFEKLQDVTWLLQAGDTAELAGDHDYPASVNITNAMHGTADRPITLKGITINGNRPKIVSTCVDAGITANGRHLTIDNIEIEGRVTTATIPIHNIRISYRGIIHGEDKLIVRNCCIHNMIMGLLSGANPGDITIEYSEFYENGFAPFEHNIYIQHSINYPDAVTRIQFCHIHDSLTAMGIKCRSHRSEIYYNYIENNVGIGMELIAMDFPEPYLRAHPSDGDVVGNVFMTNVTNSSLVRVGGDGTGAGSFGRFRFVNNTFLVSNPSNINCIRIFMGIESVELFNNLFFPFGLGPMNLLADQGGNWASGQREVAGANNWIRSVSVGMIPPELTGSIRTNTPGIRIDYTVLPGSPLLSAGTLDTVHEWPPFPHRPDTSFINPLPLPLFTPAKAGAHQSDIAARSDTTPPTIGAYGAFN